MDKKNLKNAKSYKPLHAATPSRLYDDLKPPEAPKYFFGTLRQPSLLKGHA